MKFRTFRVPIRDNNAEFKPRYTLTDVGLNSSDFYSFKYIDVFGSHTPPLDEVPDSIKLHIDKAYYSQYVPADDNIEYTNRLEITSINDIPPDSILKLVSLPDVIETDTTLFHLSYILKRALSSDAPTSDILSAIKNL